MPIVVSKPVAVIASTANATSYSTASFTPAANSLLVVFVAADGTTAAAPTLTGTGLTFTLKAVLNFNGGIDTLYAFWARVPAAPSATTLTFDCSADPATGCVILTHQITGCFRGAGAGDPFKQFAVNTGASATPGVTFGSALKTENAYLLAFGINRTSPAGVPPTGWTADGEDGHSVPIAGGAYASRVNGETGTTYAFASANANWGAMGVELRPYPAGIMARSANVMLGMTP